MDDCCVASTIHQQRWNHHDWDNSYSDDNSIHSHEFVDNEVNGNFRPGQAIFMTIEDLQLPICVPQNHSQNIFRVEQNNASFSSLGLSYTLWHSVNVNDNVTLDEAEDSGMCSMSWRSHRMDSSGRLLVIQTIGSSWPFSVRESSSKTSMSGISAYNNIITSIGRY